MKSSENLRKPTKIYDDQGGLEVIWRSFVSYLGVIWESFKGHLEVIWSHLEVIWRLSGSHLEVIWRSSGDHLEVIWTSLGVILLAQRLHVNFLIETKIRQI